MSNEKETLARKCEYICKKCGEMATAESFDAVVKMGKLCNHCLTVEKQDFRYHVKDGSNKIVDVLKKEGKPSCKYKQQKKNKLNIFVCAECGNTHNTHSKPFSCRSCGHMRLYIDNNLKEK